MIETKKDIFKKVRRAIVERFPITEEEVDTGMTLYTLGDSESGANSIGLVHSLKEIFGIDIPDGDIEIPLLVNGAGNQSDANKFGATVAEICNYIERRLAEKSVSSTSSLKGDKKLRTRLSPKIEMQIRSVTGNGYVVIRVDEFANFTVLAPTIPKVVVRPLHTFPADGNTLITELCFTPRTCNCLEKLGIVTVGDLVKYTEAEIMGIRNMGKRCVAEIKQRLEVLGMSLKE